MKRGYRTSRDARIPEWDMRVLGYPSTSLVSSANNSLAHLGEGRLTNAAGRGLGKDRAARRGLRAASLSGPAI